ncbi:MAG: glycine/sarcosine/betaine reductase selenoprotein B family protein [Pseudomonadota bacterium]
MTDQQIKAGAAKVDCPQFEKTAFTQAKPLSESCVAIVTSASMHHADEPDFAVTDTGYRHLHANRRDIVVGHWSPNFDAVGVAADLNVVFPIDRITELAEQGRIGRVADTHYAVAGNQFDLSGIRLDAGPAIAADLVREEVDVVLLTPV